MYSRGLTNPYTHLPFLHPENVFGYVVEIQLGVDPLTEKLSSCSHLKIGLRKLIGNQSTFPAPHKHEHGER